MRFCRPPRRWLPGPVSPSPAAWRIGLPRRWRRRWPAILPTIQGGDTMINGVHTIVYAEDAAKARAFFKDVLGLKSVDVGDGWLIFAAPPSEIAVHPDGQGAPSGTHMLYLMCDDVKRTVDELTKKGVEFTQPV